MGGQANRAGADRAFLQTNAFRFVVVEGSLDSPRILRRIDYWCHRAIFKKIFCVEMKESETCVLPERREEFRGIHFRFISGGVRKKTAGGSEMDREFTSVFEV
ncbi:MAG: hypothetical protein IT427_19170, partial [Pirellulales bacterium]|nr:hypothetical protein [Pirellulales bacterium]